MDKAALRQKHKDRRLNVDPKLNLAASFCIQEKLWPILKAVHCVGIYMSMKGEVQTLDLISRLLQEHKIVCVPKIIHGKMIFIRIRDFNECELSTYGILEPVSNEPYSGRIDIQIIPMLAFNERNYRLGYGKGYYDTYLRNYTGLKLGICFLSDYEPELKETQFDVKCDEILTDL